METGESRDLDARIRPSSQFDQVFIRQPCRKEDRAAFSSGRCKRSGRWQNAGKVNFPGAGPRADYLAAHMAPPTGRHDPYASLRIPNFRWFVISLLTMNVAAQLQAVVV